MEIRRQNKIKWMLEEQDVDLWDGCVSEDRDWQRASVNMAIKLQEIS
jgi:hypothetical protein